jgi:hypothetical protein
MAKGYGVAVQSWASQSLSQAVRDTAGHAASSTPTQQLQHNNLGRWLQAVTCVLKPHSMQMSMQH